MSDDSSDHIPPATNVGRLLKRNATLILPQTGERVRRSFTLRIPRHVANEDGATTPLLRRRRSTGERCGAARAAWKSVKAGIRLFTGVVMSKTSQSVLKCSFAYLLGSMATFVPQIAAFLGKQDGKHMVATVTVYFHPARSQGSMHEATLLALLAFLYAAFISVTSMGVSIFFDDRGLQALGHAIVLIVFCGGGLGLVGWVKLKLGNPLVNVACSLTSLAIITILTKEGAVQTSTFSDDKITQVLKMVVMGMFATTAVCLIFNPISARKGLRENMIKATDSLGDMLSMIARSFLVGLEQELRQPAFIAASSQYNSVFTSMKKNLREAKFEHYALGTEAQYHIEARLVNCMQRLAQNIGGLRSAATMQFTLLAQSWSGGTTNPTYASSMLSGFHDQREESAGTLSVIEEAPEDGDLFNMTQPSSMGQSVASLPPITPADIFSRFILHLGPSMKSLTYTLKQILDELPYGPGPTYAIAINPNFRSSLSEAMELYATARNEALALLYGHNDLSKHRPAEIEADFEEVAASCGHFSSCLQDFAEDMKVFLEILEELKLNLDRRPRRRSWRWLLFWRSRSWRHLGNEEDPERDISIHSSIDRDVLHSNAEGLRQRVSLDNNNQLGRYKYRYTLWKLLRGFRREDVKFAIKVGVGAALYALPSFLPSTRPFYSHWRGEWGLLSYMLVCSMTIGASNTTGFQRFLGTCLGAIGAISAWYISQGNPIALAALGWLMSLACFYIIIGKGKGPMGRFILLTYNLSALYAYSLSVKDDEDDEDEGGTHPWIAEIALHRVVAVMSGCLWGMIVTRLIWPISARKKLKDGLSVLWLRMGLLWKRDPFSMLLERGSLTPYMNAWEELQMQQSISRLDGLRQAACHEYGLKRPFPNTIYDSIIKSTGRMLDAFHAINVVIMKDLKASEGEVAILRHTSRERAQLCARITHLFQVLASSVKLEYPINDALPNTENARDRLLTKIFDYRRTSAEAPGVSDEDFALLYAYALVTGQISHEIASVSKDIEKLFGVLNEDALKLA
ncbi:hypothetical protein L228DRAFT_256962 [Xylona heveae TC161]|uniref:Integral membrane bound transporter domain-containing protein n=1 Tax=Xylona heveae (strain CBS 132557 / TC161) TaxID=1328760 RepID=A0A165A845_XYLHT|nr:hypothetical protein L228DRAFT_256962 [Xylona heveae TC161]KZF20086.1 hypothetical protein L228DRAFT_256962 [Xylona heveae TC161]